MLCFSVNGLWGQWEEWSPCSFSCGPGLSSRARSCDSPRPEHDGKYCVGLSTEELLCNEKTCPSKPGCNGNIIFSMTSLADGEWGSWTPWDSCSFSCGAGVSKRTRACDNPPPEKGGKYCPSLSQEERLCIDRPCPGNYKKIYKREFVTVPAFKLMANGVHGLLGLIVL